MEICFFSPICFDVLPGNPEFLFSHEAWRLLPGETSKYIVEKKTFRILTVGQNKKKSNCVSEKCLHGILLATFNNCSITNFVVIVRW